MKTLTIAVRSHLKLSDIENIIYGMAQGSAYWSSNCGKLGYESTVKGILKDKKSATIKDEERNKLYTLDLLKIKRGLTIMAKKEPHLFAEILTEQYDNNTSDTLLQLSLFGKLIYS